MNILHICAHLGGGVGKAHAVLAEASRDEPADGGRHLCHTYVLLEEPRDTTFVRRIAEAGGHIVVRPGSKRLCDLVEAADVVQVEWWNHPRVYHSLATTPLPAMRLALWVHISGLGQPLIPAGLLAEADRTLFTSPCSLEATNLLRLVEARPEVFGIANSGFGFASPQRRVSPRHPLRYGYLGTLDFIKMHPAIFDVIDTMDGDVRVSMWGHLDPTGEVAARAAAMRYPERIRFEGYANDPRTVLKGIDVFFYLLSPGHYGTGENALVEAMSMGATPIVWDNPAERDIVCDGRNGFVVGDVFQCASLLDRIRQNPGEVAKLGAAAAADMARSREPATTLGVFAETYARLAAQPRRRRDFAAALGRNSRAWFLSSLGADPQEAGRGDSAHLLSESRSKGSIGHFRACFPDDPSLAPSVGSEPWQTSRPRDETRTIAS